MLSKKHTLPQFLLLFCAFAIPILYWVYLLFTAQTEVKWDSFDYERLGQMLYHQGWTEFFKTGPNREPIYPFLLSLTMRISDGLHVPYLKILAVVQFALLFLTQFCCFKILQKLNGKPLFNALAVFYIGISPALVNCALSLYSEILIIALIPAAILLIGGIFHYLPQLTGKKIFLAGFAAGLILIALTLVKGIFEVAGPLIFISSFFMALRIKKPDIIKRTTLVILVGLLTFWSGIAAYKTTNKHFNGNYTLTNRGAWAFYGFAARRVEPMPKERIMAGLAFIPGEGACKRFYSEEQCYFWSFYTSDAFSFTKLKEVMAQGYEGEALDKELMRLSVEKIKTAPVQYTILSMLEGFKVFFWETTKLGFVIYPGWLSSLYDLGIFKDLLRLAWAILSLAGAIYGVRCLLTARKNNMPDGQFIILFCTISLLFFYTAIYSLFQLGPRYSVPAGPLLICLTATIAQRFFYKP
jgi:hypothetical protein